MCHGHGDLVAGNEGLDNLTKLVFLLLVVDPVKDETSLGIEQNTKHVPALLQLQNVHESCGIPRVGTDASVDLDATLHANLLTLLVGEGVFETVAEDDGDGEAFALFVGTGGGFGGPDSSHFSEVPVFGGVDTLEVLLGSAWHLDKVIGVVSVEVVF